MEADVNFERWAEVPQTKGGQNIYGERKFKLIPCLSLCIELIKLLLLICLNKFAKINYIVKKSLLVVHRKQGTSELISPYDAFIGFPLSCFAFALPPLPP